MKKILKLFLVLMIGTLFVACGGKETANKLEGKYSIKRVDYFENGMEEIKLNANVEITRKGDTYTIKGTQTELKKYAETDWYSGTVTYGDWEENTNDNFVFTGKIVKEMEGDSHNYELSRGKLYVYEFENENGVLLTIMYYPKVQIKDVIKNESDYQNIIYNGNEVTDFISIYSNNTSFIESTLKAIKEK